MTIHVINFMNSINADTLSAMQNAALNAVQQGGATDIRIHMSSDGGSNDHGFALYNFLRSLPVTLTTHCIGNVESMALIMFLAADKRCIVPHGKVEIHPMHWGFAAGTIDHDRLTEFVDSLDFDANRYSEIFEERTAGAQTLADVRKHLAGKVRLLTSAEAADAGIATEVSEAEIPKGAIIWWV